MQAVAKYPADLVQSTDSTCFICVLTHVLNHFADTSNTLAG